MGMIEMPTDGFQLNSRFIAVRYGMTADKNSMGFFFLDTTDSVVEFIPLSGATNRIFKMFYDKHMTFRGIKYAKDDSDDAEFQGRIIFDSESKVSKNEALVLSRGMETVTGVDLFVIEPLTKCCRKYLGNADTVHIPYGVAEVAFGDGVCNCKSLYIPNSVVRADIGDVPDLEMFVCDTVVAFLSVLSPYADNAFSKLKRVLLLDSFATANGQTICNNSFVNMANLEYVRIGANVSKIESRCFAELPRLQQVDFGDLAASSLSEIGGWAFEKCPSLVRLDLPLSVEHFWVENAKDFCAFYKFGCTNICGSCFALKEYSFGTTLLRNIVKLSKSKAIYSKLSKVSPARVMSFFIPKSAEKVTIRHSGYDTSKVTLVLVELPNLKVIRVPSYVVVDATLLQAIGQNIEIEYYDVD